MNGAADRRRQVFFSGNVQGVGFRYTTRSIARQFLISGYVRNLPDGRVEVVVEGAEDELGRFVQSIGARMEEYIERVEAVDGPATGEFQGFDVRF